MAKKETKAAPTGEGNLKSGTPETMAAAREARDQALAKDRFTYVGDPAKKVAPQAQTIINVIKAADMDGDLLRPEAERKGISRADLVAQLKGVLVTRQPESRILSYYQKVIQEVGAVKFEKLAVA